MKKSLLLFFLLKSIFAFSQDKYYVLNLDGADLYEDTSLSSKIIGKIKLGKEITPLEIIKTNESKKIGEEFYLEGKFLKVKLNYKTGYLFSSDLTKIKIKPEEVYDNIFFANLIGSEISKRIEKRIEKINNVEYEIEDEITEYENGSYTYTVFDSCFDHVYHLKNLSLNEVYHQVILACFIINETEKKIHFPKFHKKVNNEYLFFGEGATEGLKIIDHKDGTYTISSYDCT